MRKSTLVSMSDKEIQYLGSMFYFFLAPKFYGYSYVDSW